MKKFIFSAIAMVAFMGSSMANTIELKEGIREKEEVVVKRSCTEVSSATYYIVLENGGGIVSATVISAEVLLSCLFVKAAL